MSTRIIGNFTFFAYIASPMLFRRETAPGRLPKSKSLVKTHWLYALSRDTYTFMMQGLRTTPIFDKYSIFKLEAIFGALFRVAIQYRIPITYTGERTSVVEDDHYLINNEPSGKNNNHSHKRRAKNLVGFRNVSRICRGHNI